MTMETSPLIYSSSTASQHGKIDCRPEATGKISYIGAKQDFGAYPVYRGGSFVLQAGRSWSGVKAVIAEVCSDGDLQVDLGAEHTRLSVMLEEVGGRMMIRPDLSANEAKIPRNDNQGPMSLIPAGIEVWGQGREIRFVRHLMLKLDGPTLSELAEGDGNPIHALTLRLMFSEPRLLSLCQLIAHECVSNEPSSRLYGDSLSVTLLLALCNLDGKNHFCRGGLASWQMRRLTDYLQVHLSDDITLESLAMLVGLSRSHFCRAFRVSKRTSPYQWILQTRIARAKQLLIENAYPLAELAIEVGFADQAHFTRTFSKAVGASPRFWQRSR